MTTDVETVGPDEEISTVLTKLARASFDGYPVVDGENRVVGIVTQTDMVDVFQPSDRTVWIPIGVPPFSDVLDYGFDLSWDEFDVGVDLVKNAGKPVSTVMTEDVVSVGPDADVDDLLALLADPDRDINRVPVVDDGNHLLGIVARQDLLGAIRRQRHTGARGPPGPDTDLDREGETEL